MIIGLVHSDRKLWLKLENLLLKLNLDFQFEFHCFDTIEEFELTLTYKKFNLTLFYVSDTHSDLINFLEKSQNEQLYQGEVVFLSPQLKYAAVAMEYLAIDFLPAPFEFEHLQALFSRIQKRAIQQLSPSPLLWHYQSQNQQQYQFKYQGNFETISYLDIHFLEAKGNYAVIHTVNGNEFLFSKTLKTLTQDSFFCNMVQPHRSYQVPEIQVQKLMQSSKNSSWVIQLKSGLELPVSKHKLEEMKEILCRKKQKSRLEY